MKDKILETVVGSVAPQAKAFLEGLRKVVDLKHLQIFTPQELRLLV